MGRQAIPRDTQFARFLRDYMKRTHFGHSDMAFFCQVTEKTIHEWLRGGGPDELKARVYQRMLDRYQPLLEALKTLVRQAQVELIDPKALARLLPGV